MTNNDTTPNDVVESDTWTLQTNGMVIHYDGDELLYGDIGQQLDTGWNVAEDGLVAMKTEDAMDLTPNDDLRELVEEWRGIANQEPMDTDHDRALRYCANELEELIEE